MIVVVLEVSWTPFGSLCRVQPLRIWLASNCNTTWLDCLCHTFAAWRWLVSTKDTHRLTARCRQGSSHRDSSSPQPSLTNLRRTFPSLTLAWRPTLLASAPSIVEAETRAIQISTALREVGKWEITGNCSRKSSVTLFSSDNHKSWLHPQLQLGEEVAPLNRTPNILSVTLETYFNFGLHALDYVERARRAISIMKAVARSSLGFPTETLVGTWKAIMRPFLNYAAPICFTTCPPPIWTNSKWSRIRHWCSQKASTKRPRCSTSEPRLWSSYCTVLARVLCKRPPTYSRRSPHRCSTLVHSEQHSTPSTTEPSEACDSTGMSW